MSDLAGEVGEVLVGKTIAVIGAGTMGSALMKALLHRGVVKVQQLVASDVEEARRRLTQDELGVTATGSNVEAVSRGDIVLLAVKPQVMWRVLEEIAPHINPQRHLVISIAAGVNLAALESLLPPGTPVVRVMPNTPCLVGMGACAVGLGSHAKREHREISYAIFGAVGIVLDADEKLMDAVTALSGSGPAYVYVFIEALSDAGVRCGLNRELATRLAAQTVLGAAEMVLETGKHPGVLKDMVTSPAGTTIAALAVLEQRGFRGTVIEAVTSAFERAKELGRR